MPAERLNYSESLKQGTDKINLAIDLANNLEAGTKKYPFAETAKLLNNVPSEGFYRDAVIAIRIVNGDTSKRYYVSDFWSNHVVNGTRSFVVKSEDKSIVYSFVANNNGIAPTGTEDIRAENSNGSQLIARINWARVITQTSNYTFANTELSPYIVVPPLENKSVNLDMLVTSYNRYDTSKITDSKYIIGYDTTTKTPLLGSDGNRFVYTTEIPENKLSLPYYSTMANNTFLFGKNGVYDMVIPNASLTTSTYVDMDADGKGYVLDCIALKKAGYDTMLITFLKNSLVPYIRTYGVVPEDFNESTRYLIQKANTKNIVLPSSVRVMAGKKFNIYLNNILRYGDIYDFYRFYSTYPSYFIPRTKKHLEVIPQAVADYTWRISGYDRNPFYDDITVNVSVKHVSSTSGDGVTKKVLFIGDSMTNAAQYTQFLLDKFNDANELMNIELIGTRGTAPNKHEGRSGWRAWEYVNLQTGEYGELINNPFYNPATSTFDFNYYMTNNSFTGVDIVFINLGTNDVSRTNHNADSDIIDSYNAMINSIKAYNPNVKILMWLPPLRADFTYLSPDQKDAALRAHELLIPEFDGRESENLFLIPVYLNVDPEHDYATSDLPLSQGSSETYKYPTDIIHPATLGYQHIADMIYPYLKYVGGLS